MFWRRSTRGKRGGVANDHHLALPAATATGGRRSTRCKRGRRSTRGKRGGFNSELVTLFSEPFAWKVYDRIK